MLFNEDVNGVLGFLLWPGILFAQVQSVMGGPDLPAAVIVVIAAGFHIVFFGALLAVGRAGLLASQREGFLLEMLVVTASMAIAWYATLSVLSVVGIDGPGTLEEERNAFYVIPVLLVLFRAFMFAVIGTTVISASRTAANARKLVLFAVCVPLIFQLFAYRRGIPWMLREHDALTNVAVFLVAPIVLALLSGASFWLRRHNRNRGP